MRAALMYWLLSVALLTACNREVRAPASDQPPVRADADPVNPFSGYDFREGDWKLHFHFSPSIRSNPLSRDGKTKFFTIDNEQVIARFVKEMKFSFECKSCDMATPNGGLELSRNGKFIVERAFYMSKDELSLVDPDGVLKLDNYDMIESYKKYLTPDPSHPKH